MSFGSTIQINTSTYPSSANLLGRSARGRTIQFQLDALPGSVAALLFGHDPTLLPLEPLTPGSLLVNYEVVFAPVFVPASGVTAIPFTVPTTWPLGQTYFGQFLTLEPNLTTLWATNTFPWHTSS